MFAWSVRGQYRPARSWQQGPSCFIALSKIYISCKKRVIFRRFNRPVGNSDLHYCHEIYPFHPLDNPPEFQGEGTSTGWFVFLVTEMMCMWYKLYVCTTDTNTSELMKQLKQLQRKPAEKNLRLQRDSLTKRHTIYLWSLMALSLFDLGLRRLYFPGWRRKASCWSRDRHQKIQLHNFIVDASRRFSCSFRALIPPETYVYEALNLFLAFWRDTELKYFRNDREIIEQRSEKRPRRVLLKNANDSRNSRWKMSAVNLFSVTIDIRDVGAWGKIATKAAFSVRTYNL